MIAVRLRVTLYFALPLAGIALALIGLGPVRLQNLTCRLAGCSAAAQAERLCTLATEGAGRTPAELREAFLATWPPREGRWLLDRLDEAGPGAEYDVLLDAQASGGTDAPAFICPALLAAAPVVVTPKQIVVQGRRLHGLEGGAVPPAALDGTGMAIGGLPEALGYSPDGSPIEVAVHGDTPYWTLAQLAYSLGRAGVPRMTLRVRGEPDRTVPVDLPSYGTCPACLADLADARWIESEAAGALLVALGRRSPDRTLVAADHLAVLALTGDGSAHWASAKGESPRRFAPLAALAQAERPDGPRLVVTAAPGVRATHVSQALEALPGPPEAEPVILVIPHRVLRGGDLGGALGSSSRSLATQNSLQKSLEQDQRPRRAPAVALTRRAPTRRASRRLERLEDQAAPAQLARSIRPKLTGLRHCYERALKLRGRLSGKVTLHFDLAGSGRPSNVRLEDHSLGDRHVLDCIARRARAWRLPAPGGEPISVAYPLVFTPTGT